MLDGDECTIKTLEDEQIEIKQKLIADGEDEEDEIMIEEAQIERASDDE